MVLSFCFELMVLMASLMAFELAEMGTRTTRRFDSGFSVKCLAIVSVTALFSALRNAFCWSRLAYIESVINFSLQQSGKLTFATLAKRSFS